MEGNRVRLAPPRPPQVSAAREATLARFGSVGRVPSNMGVPNPLFVPSDSLMGGMQQRASMVGGGSDSDDSELCGSDHGF